MANANKHYELILIMLILIIILMLAVIRTSARTSLSVHGLKGIFAQNHSIIKFF
jgi:hypothetical protein